MTANEKDALLEFDPEQFAQSLIDGEVNAARIKKLSGQEAAMVALALRWSDRSGAVDGELMDSLLERVALFIGVTEDDER